MKIALIEDRIGRLNQYADPEIKKVSILKIITEDDFSALLKEIEDLNFNKLDNYTCLIFHRSALENKHRQALMSYCLDHKKPLVFFSGSISSSTYQDSKFPFLYINSRDFYSEHLLLFLKDAQESGIINLLKLQFGDRWKLNQLLNLRNKINSKIPTGLITRIRNFEISKNIKIELQDKYDIKWLVEDEMTSVSAENIQEFRLKLNALINDSI